MENGRSRVPIPPAVMSAAYPRIPFCPDASRLDPECSLPTRYCPNGVEERAAYVNVMFSTWVQPPIHAAIGAHSNTRGICDDLACFGLKGRHAEEDARRGIFPPAFGPKILSEVKTVVQVLITGGNGFIGSHLAERLEESGHSVTLFDLHFNGNTTSLQGLKIRGDVRDYGAVKDAVAGHDAVFHFAAVSRVAWGQMDPYTCWTTNQLGTLNVLEACRNSEARPVLFYASSREVYGEPQYLPVDEDHPKKPLSVYGMTKLCAERACGSYADPSLSPSVHPVIFRFSNVYGSERDLPERVIPKFMRKALLDEDITLYGGDQVLDFTYIDDTISGILKAFMASLDGGSGVSGQEFHFVTGRGVSVSDLATMIVGLTDSSSRIIQSPPNNFEVRRFVGDPGKSHKVLGHEPRVRLEEGLKILRERMLRF